MMNTVFYSLQHMVEGPLTCLLFVRVTQMSLIAPIITVGGSFWAKSGYKASTMELVEDPNFETAFYTAVATGLFEAFVLTAAYGPITQMYGLNADIVF